MTGIVQLRSGSQTCRARTYNRYFFTSAYVWFTWFYKSFIESYFNNMLFNFLNCNSRLVNTQYTGAFAWRRAYTAGKLRKVVGRGKNFISLLPALAVYRIVKLWYYITQRTSAMAKRNATIHTTGRLLVQLFIAVTFNKFIVIL